MCGITGWIDWQHDLRKEEKEMLRMSKTLHHRGPDDMNVWSSKHAALGHTRLVVVDPEGGVQPMKRTVNGKDYLLVYNGELYNTEELRAELLKAGHSFQGHSDTEVLLVAYIEWGYQCLERLNGIFAFAIWNDKSESLFMARDRMGVKPLFYTVRNGSLLFGSELKAILAHRTCEAVVEREGLAEIIGLSPSRTPGHGIYKGISELRPGHLLIYDRNGAKVSRYWSLKSKAHQQTTEETADYIRWLMEDIVERQLYADVPVGMFLSGGLDSSALTALAAQVYRRQREEPIRSYSIDYDENDKYFKANEFQPNADGPWVKQVSEAIGTSHRNAIISVGELTDQLEHAVRVRDLPGMADIDSSLLWFCQEVKKKKSLSGCPGNVLMRFLADIRGFISLN